MKIERKTVDAENKIIRITTEDERWYSLTDKEGNISYIPSVTWVCEHYPKGIAYFKWLASKGWDEAEAIKSAAGEKGSVVHNAVSMLLSGEKIKHNALFTDEKGNQREITGDEYEGVISFSDWWKENNPTILAFDETVFAQDQSYAGTLDLRVKIGDAYWLIDLKTSAYIWPSHRLQVSAYKHCGYENHNIGILQVGYKLNKKKKFKFTEIEDQFDLFLAAQKIWSNETADIKPLQRDFPMEVKL